MNVAIPILNQQIAPCFDAAKTFQVITIKNGLVDSSKTIKCLASEGFMRVRLLRLYEIDTLICNGIKSFYKDQLTSLGITVIPNVNKSKEDAVNSMLQGKLSVYSNNYSLLDRDNIVSHESLVAWSKDLFESKNYQVFSYKEKDSFLIDLVAQTNCPVCGKQIKVAICCGAQTYNVNQEIREFYHVAKTPFDSMVYVYLTNPQIEQSCDEYGIDFISSDTPTENIINKNKSAIPLLTKPIEGHEKAFFTSA